MGASTHSASRPSAHSPSTSSRRSSRSSASAASRRLPTPSEGIARKVLDRAELVLGPAPEGERALAAERGDDLVVRGRRPAECEAAVPAARALGDPPRVDDAHAKPGLGQGERACAARHAGADDADVHAFRQVAPRQRLRRLVQPVRRRHRAIVLRTTPSSTAIVPASSSSVSAVAREPAASPVARPSSSAVTAPTPSASSTAAQAGSSGTAAAAARTSTTDSLEHVGDAGRRRRTGRRSAFVPRRGRS